MKKRFSLTYYKVMPPNLLKIEQYEATHPFATASFRKTVVVRRQYTNFKCCFCLSIFWKERAKKEGKPSQKNKTKENWKENSIENFAMKRKSRYTLFPSSLFYSQLDCSKLFRVFLNHEISLCGHDRLE